MKYVYLVFVPGSGAQTQHRSARRACAAFDRLTETCYAGYSGDTPVVHMHDGTEYAEITIATVRDYARREWLREATA